MINGQTEGDISSGILRFNMFNGCYLAGGTVSNGKRANRRGCQIGQVVLGICSLDEANGQTEGDDSSYEYLVPICGGEVFMSGI